jgi:hypothetical protein
LGRLHNNAREQVGVANIEIVRQLYKAFAERNIPEILAY